MPLRRKTVPSDSNNSKRSPTKDDRVAFLMERSVIGGLLLRPDAIEEAEETHLKPRDFGTPRYRDTFEAILTVHRRGDPITLPAVAEALTKAKAPSFRDVDVASVVEVMRAEGETGGSVGACAKSVREHGTRRRVA